MARLGVLAADRRSRAVVSFMTGGVSPCGTRCVFCFFLCRRFFFAGGATCAAWQRVLERLIVHLCDSSQCLNYHPGGFTSKESFQHHLPPLFCCFVFLFHLLLYSLSVCVPHTCTLVKCAGQTGTRATGLAVKLLLDLILEASTVASTPSSTMTAGAGGTRGGATGNMAPAVERGRGFSFAGCRLMLFLGGAPDRGPGAVGMGPVPSAGGEEGEEEEQEGFVHDQLFRGEVTRGRGGGGD